MKLLAVGLFLLVAVSVHADVTTLTNRVDWETAAGGGTGNILDNLDSGSKVSGVITRTGYTVSGSGVAAFPNGNANTTVDGTGYLRATLSGGNVLAFNFDAPIIAIGYDINPQDSDVGMSVNLTTNGVFAGTYTLPENDVTVFMGIVFSAPVLTLDLTAAGSSSWHGIDNLEAFNSAPVPEPSPLALGVIGAAVACVSKRRRN